MKPAIYLILFFLLISCKQKTSIERSNTKNLEPQVIESSKKINPFVEDLAHFAKIAINDSINPDEVFLAKQVDKDGNITSLDLKNATVLYKKVISNQSDNSPIFEVINSNNCILITKSNGYTDAIWAKILIDKTTLLIKNIEFDHKGESEGYGASFTLSSFEDKFIGSKVSFTSNTFGLLQDNKLVVKGDHEIDGISGATITSQSTVEMVNNELLKYKDYFHN